MAKEGFTFTKAEVKKFKAKEAKATPAQQKAASEALVKANSAANGGVPKKKKA